MPNIVIIGAGVSGLTTALLLSKNPSYHITIIAKHMPGDYDVEYTSPWAGAGYLPTSTEADSRWEKNTWPYLAKLAAEVPAAGIHFQESECYYREKDGQGPVGQWLNELFSTNPWFASVVPNFRILPKEKLPKGIDGGTAYTARGILQHINEAAALHQAGRADVVINCTGLLAARLGGVMDKAIHQVRGQTVVVRNSPGKMITVSGTDDGEDEVAYVMERAAGGGTVLGGTYQKGSRENVVDMNQAARIMKRALALCPQLVKEGEGIEGLSIVRHSVGFRPLREGGVRLEREKLGDLQIVHNYGHGGWGYQASYGCAERVVELVDEVFRESVKAKL